MLGRRVRTPPGRASCRALGCNAIRSARPGVWLRRRGRPRKVTPCVDVKIVLNQNDRPCVREVDVGEVFQDVCIIHGGMAIGDLDTAPSPRAGQTS